MTAVKPKRVPKTLWAREELIWAADEMIRSSLEHAPESVIDLVQERNRIAGFLKLPKRSAKEMSKMDDNND